MKITVLDKGKQFYINLVQGQSLMSALIEHDAGISAFCGGKGICGKCKVQVIRGEIPASSEDGRIFSEQELSEGYRLACMSYPDTGCTIRLCMEKEQEMEVVTDVLKAELSNAADRGRNSYAIAVDIGTTTIAMQLVEENTNRIFATYTGLNPQRSYGADVINRIQAANSGKGQKLQQMICSVLEKGFMELLHDSGRQPEEVKFVVISANTTMIHLLMGYPCGTLGVSPFQPYNINTVTISMKELIPESILSCNLRVIPGISAFVGGDIVSGLYYCNLLEQDKPILFVDLGTNGEMALGNKEKLLVTSVAAGPAFEGGNLSCGVGSIPGAISGVTMERGKIAKIKTIQNREPLGICGTGVIETVAELVKEELLDETGLLDEELFDQGLVVAYGKDGRKIVMTQKDIREIQLAKSAVRSGIEVLLQKYGITYDKIDKVYFAGGFGYHMNSKKMIQIRMIPAELAGKIVAVGNSSLGGAKKALFSDESWLQYEKIAALGEEINLAMDLTFQEKYMEHLYF